MDPILKRLLAKRDYVDPEKLIVPVKDATGNYTESFQAGFVAFMVQRMAGTAGRVRVSFGEVQDADAVLMLDNPTVELAGETPAFKLVQLKEFHPRCGYSFQQFLDKLKLQYTKSANLLLAIHINQDVKIDLRVLDFTGFGVEGVYLLGADGDSEKLHGGVVSDWISGVIWEGCLRDGRISVRHLRFRGGMPRCS